MSQFYGCTAFPVFACACLHVSQSGASSRLPPSVRLSVRHALRHKRLEREPSKASPKGSDAATGEGWLQGHERGCWGLLTGPQTPDATYPAPYSQGRSGRVPTRLLLGWAELSPKTPPLTTSQAGKPSLQGSRCGCSVLCCVVFSTGWASQRWASVSLSTDARQCRGAVGRARTRRAVHRLSPVGGCAVNGGREC